MKEEEDALRLLEYVAIEWSPPATTHPFMEKVENTASQVAFGAVEASKAAAEPLLEGGLLPAGLIPVVSSEGMAVAVLQRTDSGTWAPGNISPTSFLKNGAIYGAFQARE